MVTLKRRRSVIARGYGDKPTRMWAAEVGDGRVLIENQARTGSISLPEADVYRFRHALIADLRRAYSQEDKPELKRLWDRAEVFSL